MSKTFDTGPFKMDVLDSLVSKELGLVVTGEIESGSVGAGAILKAVTKKGNFQVEVKFVTGPRMNVLQVADSGSGYVGLVIKGKKGGDIVRGDMLLASRKG